VREEFDALHVVCRKTAAVMVLLEEIVVDEAADFRLYEPVEAGGRDPAASALPQCPRLLR
jgi:hypothetical protein